MTGFKVQGLRRRGLLKTISVVTALGLACVFGITAVFAAYYYSAMNSDMRYRARTTADFFANYQNLNYNDYYQSCVKYANTFEDKNNIELQFINASGGLVASSYGDWVGSSPATPEIV